MTTTPDLTSYHGIHIAIRRGAHALATAAQTIDVTDRKRVEAFARYWKGYAGELLAHHTIEDDILFPTLVERVPVAADLIARTDDDHHRLDELMAAAAVGVEAIQHGGDTVALACVLGELAHLIDEHLDFEDADILPLFERHFDADEYEALDQRATKALGISTQAAFTVPFVAAFVPPAMMDHMFEKAPFAFKVLYWLTRGRYARLAAAALGNAAVQDAVAA